MAISNFTSGQVNRYGDEVYIASNAFQFMVTFIVSQFIISFNQIIKSNREYANKTIKTSKFKATTILATIKDTLRFENHCCPF